MASIKMQSTDSESIEIRVDGEDVKCIELHLNGSLVLIQTRATCRSCTVYDSKMTITDYSESVPVVLKDTF